MPLPFTFTQSLLYIEQRAIHNKKSFPETDFTLIHYYQRADELCEAIAFYKGQPVDFTSVIGALTYRRDMCRHCIKMIMSRERKACRKQLIKVKEEAIAG